VKAESTNPFSTKFVRPGALCYQRPDGGSVEQLVRDFDQRCLGWASIIGPHGTGKSTLISHLKTLFETLRPVYAYRLSMQERSSMAMKRDRNQWKAGVLVIVDGYEQMSTWSAWRLLCWVRRRQAGLLITGHQPIRGFNILWETSIDEEIARQLRNQLLGSRLDLLVREDLELAWQRARLKNPTDIRETLFAMYDWAEEIRASQSIRTGE
jgi:energy-coupling factor transporter ATP-binding protein EcfA2